MLNKLRVSALAIVASMTLALPAAATCWRSDCGGPAFAAAGAGGFAGTAMNGHWEDTFSNQIANTLTRADTDPNYAAAVASLDQETGGIAGDRYGVAGELYMEGQTNVYAQVGRRGVGMDTYTEGTGIGGGMSTGGYVELSLYGKSNQHSLAVDTPRGGYSDGQAQQLTVGSVFGHASGDNEAATEVGVSVTSYAETN